MAVVVTGMWEGGREIEKWQWSRRFCKRGTLTRRMTDCMMEQVRAHMQEEGRAHMQEEGRIHMQERKFLCYCFFLFSFSFCFLFRLFFLFFIFSFLICLLISVIYCYFLPTSIIFHSISVIFLPSFTVFLTVYYFIYFTILLFTP